MKLSQEERNRFIGRLQLFAQQRMIRITFLSGDVHCAAVGVLKTLQKGKTAASPESDHRYMLNVVTSTFRPRGESYVTLTPTFRCDCQLTVSTLINASASSICDYLRISGLQVVHSLR
jgi:hypothetical protein